MRNNSCLSESDLALYYYGELSTSDELADHLADCLICRKRLSALRDDLAKLPILDYEPDDAAGTRMTASISEKLNKRRRNRIPALGVSAIAAFAVVISIAVWSPQRQPVQSIQSPAPLHEALSLNEDMPDIDFLEDLELLKELELLSQIEGV